MAARTRALRLWRWARHKVKDPIFARQPDAHEMTAAFVDGVYFSSKMLRYVLPVTLSVNRLRHSLRGREPPPELYDVERLTNWIPASDFLRGAEAAHECLLEALWRPHDAPLPSGFHEATSSELRQWLETVRAQEGMDSALGRAETSEGAAGADGAETRGSAEILAVSACFEDFSGPKSLEQVRDLTGDLSGWRTWVGSEDRWEAWQRDLVRGSTLTMQVASVAEARLPGDLSVRRADRLHLVSDFNLREGIASDFRLTQVDELLEEARKGGFVDDLPEAE